MNYQQQLLEHFESPELAEQFFFRIMKQLQLITCSGQLKISDVNGVSHTCLVLQLPEKKVGDVVVIPAKEHFIHSRTTLDESDPADKAEIRHLTAQLSNAYNNIHHLEQLKGQTER